MARAGGDKRGSNGDRLRRRRWLVSPGAGREVDGLFISFGGDGWSVPCWWKCGRIVTELTVEADRVAAGGSYRRENIVPACRPCNLARSDDDGLNSAEIAERVAATTARTGRLTPALTAG
jgi:5-methylcytosine-specific restriction endonuclease McrA